MERSEAELIAAVLKGETASFEPLVQKYSPRVFATARRYARRESEIEDIAQEVWLKAFHKLKSFRGDAPFEHWLMRLAVRTCYDFLRAHQRNREATFSDLSEPESDWLDRFAFDRRRWRLRMPVSLCSWRRGFDDRRRRRVGRRLAVCGWAVVDGFRRWLLRVCARVLALDC